jgi:hypothetical protein
MKRIAEFRASLPAIGFLLLGCASSLAAQSRAPLFVKITPNSVSIPVGGSASFRLVDQAGHMVPHVAWHVSDPDAFWIEDGEEFSITAKEPGDYRVDGRTPDGEAEATVRVTRDDASPGATPQWISGGVEGCKTVKIARAMPNSAGVAVYQQTECDDGNYIAAYRADGVQLWRTKVSDTGVPPSAAGMIPANPPARLNARSKSVCDSISVGDDQARIRDLLHQQDLTSSESNSDHSWTIDESNTQCVLWFDEKSLVSKKRKVFVTK